MKKHVLSTVALVAMVLLGSATSFIYPIHADVRRTPDSIVFTNLDDFGWERTYITLQTDVTSETGKFYVLRAEIGTVAAGETREVPLSEIKDEENFPYSIETHGEMRLYIECSAPRGEGSLEGGPLFLSSLPFAE